MRFHRQVDFSGFSLEIPPVVITLDTEIEDPDVAFRAHVARYLEAYLGDVVPSGVEVSGHPASHSGIVRTKRQGNRRGKYLGSFSVGEGHPPFRDYVRVGRRLPLVAALAVGGLFVWAGCTGRTDMAFSAASVGVVLGSMALVAVVVVVVSILAQYAAWREWEPGEDLPER